MKRIFAVVLALAVLSIVMLGCSSAPDSDPQESDISSSGDSQTPSVDENLSEDDVGSTVDEEWQNGSDSVEIGSMI